MATHSNIIVWRIPMDRGAWQAIVHGVVDLDTTEATSHAHTHINPIRPWGNDLALHPLVKLTCMLMISIQASDAEGFSSFLQAAMSLFGALNT